MGTLAGIKQIVCGSLPWATILATSALIAHMLGAMLAPALALETDTRPAPNEQSPSAAVEDRSRGSVTDPSIEATGALTRVHCPSDPDVDTDIQVLSLQDLDLLISSLCVVQQQAAG
jgi:hypothetical protein